MSNRIEWEILSSVSYGKSRPQANYVNVIVPIGNLEWYWNIVLIININNINLILILMRIKHFSVSCRTRVGIVDKKSANCE